MVKMLVLDSSDRPMGKAYGNNQNVQYLLPGSLLWFECEIPLPAKRLWSFKLLRLRGLLKLD